MFDIDNIAVPIDFSRSSRAAVSMARSLADADTEIELLHVVAAWPAFMNDVLFPYAPLGEDGVEIEQELVDSARHALHEYHELDEATDLEIRFGPLKETLADAIRSTPSQLLVMGASGESGAHPDSLGSVAERLIRSSGRPTLLVRSIDVRPSLDKILLALDLTEGSRRVAEFALRLALRTDAALEVIHVVPDPLANDQSNVLGTALHFDQAKVTNRAGDRVIALFDRMIRSLQPNFSEQDQIMKLLAHRRVTFGDPAGEIIRYAQESGADLIVAGSQTASRVDSTYLGRVASAVARRSPTHVAVVPVPALSRLSDDD